MNSKIKADHWIRLTDKELKVWKDIAPNFTPKELASNGDGSLVVEKHALIALQKLRDAYGKPLTINSAYRDPAYNRAVGGSKNSKHVLGVAFDISVTDQVMAGELQELAQKVGFTAIGRYNTFIHVDARPPKEDGKLYYWDLRTW